MIVAERENLKLVKQIVTNAEIDLALWEDNKGNMFVSTQSNKPEGVVYFGSTPSLLCQFLESSIVLQTLLDKTPSVFVEVSTNSKKVLYSTRDLQIELKCGDRTINQLAGNCRVEIWQGLNEL